MSIVAGFIAVLAGWFVTEVGRQPWIIYQVMRTADAVTPVPGLHVVFWTIVGLYTTLGILSFGVLWRLFERQMRETDDEASASSPDGAEVPA